MRQPAAGQRAGIRFFSSHAKIRGNTIGPDVTGLGIFPWPNQNGIAGLMIFGSDNLVEGNVVAGNNGDGVMTQNPGAVRNTITANAIYSNTASGIALYGGNGGIFPPLFTKVSPTDVRGLSIPNSTVEVFSDAADQGRWYQGAAAADAGGHFTFTAALPFTGTFVTGTATDLAGNTSEFGSPFAPVVDGVATAVFVPQSRHQAGLPITPTVQVANAGSAPATLTVTAVITQNSARIYEEEQIVADVGALIRHTMSFPAWTPPAAGAYTFEVTVRTAAADDDPANDSLTVSFIVADARADLWARDNATDDGSEPSTGPRVGRARICGCATPRTGARRPRTRSTGSPTRSTWSSAIAAR